MNQPARRPRSRGQRAHPHAPPQSSRDAKGKGELHHPTSGTLARLPGSRDKTHTNPKTKWTTQSQKSLTQQNQLQLQLENLHTLISQCKANIRRSQEKARDQLQQIATGRGGLAQINLTDALTEQKTEKEKQKAYQAHARQLESQIQILTHPTPSQKALRLHNQNLLAKLARHRLKTDRHIDHITHHLIKALQQRQETTTLMRHAADKIQFTFLHDGIDSQRYEQLLTSLPSQPQAPNSQIWLEWLLGRNTKTHRVRHDFTLSETLARPGGPTNPDHTVHLHETEAQSLLSTNDPPIHPHEPNES